VSTEVLTLSVEPPEVEAIARTIEVRCGDSYVTVKQMDGRLGRKWTVYNMDGRGMNGPIQEAPVGPDAAEVLPWAHELVRRKERERLAYAELRRKLGDAIPATDQG
jgi:hypothetical protein